MEGKKVGVKQHLLKPIYKYVLEKEERQPGTKRTGIRESDKGRGSSDATKQGICHGGTVNSSSVMKKAYSERTGLKPLHPNRTGWVIVPGANLTSLCTVR